MDVAIVDGLNRIVFTIEYSGRAGMLEHFRRDSASFNHGTILCDVTEQDSESTGWGIWIVQATDCAVVQDFLSFDVLRNGMTVRTDGGGVNEIATGELR